MMPSAGMGAPLILGTVGLLLGVAGIALACRAEHYIGRTAQLELVAGVLFIGALLLSGAGLAWALSPMEFVRP